MPRQKSSAIVPLIQEQTHRISLAETEFKPDAVLHHLKRRRRRFPPNQLRRGLRHGRAPDLPGQHFVVPAPNGEGPAQPLQFLQLSSVQRPLRLRQQILPHPVHPPSRPAVTRAVYQPIRIRQPRLNHGRPQRQPRILLKIQRRPQQHRRVRHRMRKPNLGRMQKNPRRSRSAIQRVAQDGKTTFRRMHPNLMGASSARFGPNQPQSGIFYQPLGIRHWNKPRLGRLAARAAGILVPHPDQQAFRRERRPRNRALRQ